jgi:hypothetical protein
MMIQTDPKTKIVQSIIGALLWLLSCVISYITFNASLGLIGRIYGRFWLQEGVYRSQQAGISVQQFALIPLAIFFLAGIVIGGDLIMKYASKKPDYIWKFFGVFLGIQFVILILAALI